MRIWAALALLLLPLAVASAAASPDSHTFTDQFGRTFTGEIVEATDAQIKVRRADGQEFEMTLASLSPADTAYVAQWRREHVTVRLRLEAGQFHNTGPNQSRNSATLQQTVEVGYDIKVTNDSRDPTAALRLEYNVFALRNGTDTRVRGFAAVGPLTLKQTTTIRTEAVNYTKSTSTRGVASQTAEVKGLWARVLLEGKIVAEFLTSEGLRIQGWQEVSPAGRGGRRGAAPDGSAGRRGGAQGGF
jgi:hypothetical protein